MTNWKSSEVLDLWGYLYSSTTVFCSGMYWWEFVLTFHHVEWRLLNQMIKFKPIYIPYLLGRYSVLTTTIAYVITTVLSMEMNCQVAYDFFSTIGFMGVGAASSNLVLRPLSIYICKSWWAAGALTILCLIHWTLCIYVGVTDLKAYWDVEKNACVVTSSNSVVVAVLYLYTMLFDFVILISTWFGLRDGMRRGGFMDYMQKQGIWYLVITWAVNVPSAILPFLQLNSYTNVIWTIPGLIISVIASSRMVIMITRRGKEERAKAINSSDYSEGTLTSKPQLTSRIMMGLDPSASLGDSSQDHTAHV